MTNPWFRSLGWTYRPISWQGYTAVGVVALFCVQAFLAIDQHSHSASDTLIGFFPYGVPAFLLLNWFAAKKCAA